MAVGQSIK